MNKHTQKTFVLLLTIIIAPLIAGAYGILHDQLTYSISPEYYTRFKFIQFGFYHGTGEAIIDNPRLAVCGVGFMATWWTGLFIGPIIAFFGLIQRDAMTAWKANFRGIILTLVVTALTGLAGLLYGWLYLSKTGVSWPLPEGLVNKNAFIAVGSMHNFSYLGGLFGLIGAVVLQVRTYRKNKKLTADKSAH